MPTAICLDVQEEGDLEIWKDLVRVGGDWPWKSFNGMGSDESILKEIDPQLILLAKECYTTPLK